MNLLKYILIFIGLPLSIISQAQTDTIKIKTSAHCEMCKSSIEKKLSRERGVKSAVLNLSTKEVTVIYKTSKTNPDKLRECLNHLGYDADDKPANNRAFKAHKDACIRPETPSEKKEVKDMEEEHRE